MDQKKTFALFLLLVIAIFIPFGSIIAVSIGKYYGFTLNCSVFSGFISNICINHSDNRHLSQNVDALDTCKRHLKRHLPELLQQLILKLRICNVTLLKWSTTCILSIKLAWYMQVKRKALFF